MRNVSDPRIIPYLVSFSTKMPINRSIQLNHSFKRSSVTLNSIQNVWTIECWMELFKGFFAMLNQCNHSLYDLITVLIKCLQIWRPFWEGEATEGKPQLQKNIFFTEHWGKFAQNSVGRCKDELLNLVRTQGPMMCAMWLKYQWKHWSCVCTCMWKNGFENELLKT